MFRRPERDWRFDSRVDRSRNYGPRTNRRFHSENRNLEREVHHRNNNFETRGHNRFNRQDNHFRGKDMGYRVDKRPPGSDSNRPRSGERSITLGESIDRERRDSRRMDRGPNLSHPPEVHVAENHQMLVTFDNRNNFQQSDENPVTSATDRPVISATNRPVTSATNRPALLPLQLPPNQQTIVEDIPLPTQTPMYISSCQNWNNKQDGNEHTQVPVQRCSAPCQAPMESNFFRPRILPTPAPSVIPVQAPMGQLDIYPQATFVPPDQKRLVEFQGIPRVTAGNSLLVHDQVNLVNPHLQSHSECHEKPEIIFQRQEKETPQFQHHGSFNENSLRFRQPRNVTEVSFKLEPQDVDERIGKQPLYQSNIEDNRGPQHVSSTCQGTNAEIKGKWGELNEAGLLNLLILPPPPPPTPIQMPHPWHASLDWERDKREDSKHVRRENNNAQDIVERDVKAKIMHSNNPQKYDSGDFGNRTWPEGEVLSRQSTTGNKVVSIHDRIQSNYVSIHIPNKAGQAGNQPHHGQGDRNSGAKPTGNQTALNEHVVPRKSIPENHSLKSATATVQAPNHPKCSITNLNYSVTRTPCEKDKVMVTGTKDLNQCQFPLPPPPSRHVMSINSHTEKQREDIMAPFSNIKPEVYLHSDFKPPYHEKTNFTGMQSNNVTSNKPLAYLEGDCKPKIFPDSGTLDFKKPSNSWNQPQDLNFMKQSKEHFRDFQINPNVPHYYPDYKKPYIPRTIIRPYNRDRYPLDRRPWQHRHDGRRLEEDLRYRRSSFGRDIGHVMHPWVIGERQPNLPGRVDNRDQTRERRHFPDRQDFYRDEFLHCNPGNPTHLHENRYKALSIADLKEVVGNRDVHKQEGGKTGFRIANSVRFPDSKVYENHSTVIAFPRQKVDLFTPVADGENNTNAVSDSMSLKRKIKEIEKTDNPKQKHLQMADVDECRSVECLTDSDNKAGKPTLKVTSAVIEKVLDTYQKCDTKAQKKELACKKKVGQNTEGIYDNSEKSFMLERIANLEYRKFAKSDDISDHLIIDLSPKPDTEITMEDSTTDIYEEKHKECCDKDVKSLQSVCENEHVCSKGKMSSEIKHSWYSNYQNQREDGSHLKTKVVRFDGRSWSNKNEHHNSKTGVHNRQTEVKVKDKAKAERKDSKHQELRKVKEKLKENKLGNREHQKGNKHQALKKASKDLKEPKSTEPSKCSCFTEEQIRQSAKPLGEHTAINEVRKRNIKTLQSQIDFGYCMTGGERKNSLKSMELKKIHPKLRHKIGNADIEGTVPTDPSSSDQTIKKLSVVLTNCSEMLADNGTINVQKVSPSTKTSANGRKKRPKDNKSKGAKMQNKLEKVKSQFSNRKTPKHKGSKSRGKYILTTPNTLEIVKPSKQHTYRIGQSKTDESAIKGFKKVENACLAAKQELLYRSAAIQALTRNKSKPLVMKKTDGKRISGIARGKIQKHLEKIVKSGDTAVKNCQEKGSDEFVQRDEREESSKQKSFSVHHKAMETLDKPCTDYKPKRTTITKMSLQCLYEQAKPCSSEIRLETAAENTLTAVANKSRNCDDEVCAQRATRRTSGIVQMVEVGSVRGNTKKETSDDTIKTAENGSMDNTHSPIIDVVTITSEESTDTEESSTHQIDREDDTASASELHVKENIPSFDAKTDSFLNMTGNNDRDSEEMVDDTCRYFSTNHKDTAEDNMPFLAPVDTEKGLTGEEMEAPPLAPECSGQVSDRPYTLSTCPEIDNDQTCLEDIAVGYNPTMEDFKQYQLAQQYRVHVNLNIKDFCDSSTAHCHYQHVPLGLTDSSFFNDQPFLLESSNFLDQVYAENSVDREKDTDNESEIYLAVPLQLDVSNICKENTQLPSTDMFENFEMFSDASQIDYEPVKLSAETPRSYEQTFSEQKELKDAQIPATQSQIFPTAEGLDNRIKQAPVEKEINREAKLRSVEETPKRSEEENAKTCDHGEELEQIKISVGGSKTDTEQGNQRETCEKPSVPSDRYALRLRKGRRWGSLRGRAEEQSAKQKTERKIKTGTRVLAEVPKMMKDGTNKMNTVKRLPQPKFNLMVTTQDSCLNNFDRMAVDTSQDNCRDA